MKIDNHRTTYKFSRQDELLILCARLALSEPEIQALQKTLPGLDWDHLIWKANWHRLTPLVAKHLDSQELGALVPAHFRDKLRNIRRSNLAQNMLMQDELSRILKPFNREEIPVIVLKGAALLETVYPDISLRPVGDIDILVRPEHLDRAETIALEQGYRFIADRKTQEKTRIECRHLANLYNPERKIFLEIHHHIVSPDEPYRFNIEGFWARAHAFKVMISEALTFSPEDFLVHLCIKFLLDRRYSSNSALGQLCDVSEILRLYHDLLDWDLIETVSRESNIQRGLHFVLYTCRKLLGAPVPLSVLDRVQPPDFDIDLADLFVRRRVLDSRPWLAHGLTDSQRRFRHQNISQTIFHRFVSTMRQVFTGNNGGEKSGFLNRERLKVILSGLGYSLLNPSELKEDFQLDRWLQELSNTN